MSFLRGRGWGDYVFCIHCIPRLRCLDGEIVSFFCGGGGGGGGGMGGGTMFCFSGLSV